MNDEETLKKLRAERFRKLRDAKTYEAKLSSESINKAPVTNKKNESILKIKLKQNSEKTVHITPKRLKIVLNEPSSNNFSVSSTNNIFSLDDEKSKEILSDDGTEEISIDYILDKSGRNGTKESYEIMESNDNDILEEIIENDTKKDNEDDIYQDKDYFTLLAECGTKKNLLVIDHSKQIYDDIRKNIYIESPELVNDTLENVQKFRSINSIVVHGKNCPNPITDFRQIGLSQNLMNKLNKMGIFKPLPVQAQAIPAILCGNHTVVTGSTGSGKTLAYLLPMIKHVHMQPKLQASHAPRGLILIPTRELALQIITEANRFGQFYKLKVTAVYGGARLSHQLGACKRHCDIVVATPGRLVEILSMSKVLKINYITMLVLDEVDRLFDTGFSSQVETIMSLIRPDLQLVLVSATFPYFLNRVLGRWLRHAIKIKVTRTVKEKLNVKHYLRYISNTDSKLNFLLKLLGEWYEHGEKILIFTANQENCVNLCAQLINLGYPSLNLHSGQDQEERIYSIADFHGRKKTILVSTSLGSRGLDFKNVVIVINYDAPDHLEDYIHKAGRTGRSDNIGIVYTFFDDNSKKIAVEIAKLKDDFFITADEVILEWLNEDEEEKKNCKQKVVSNIPYGYRGKGYSFTYNEEKKDVTTRKSSLDEQAQDKSVIREGIVDKIQTNNKNTNITNSQKTSFIREAINKMLDSWTSMIVDPAQRAAQRQALYPTVKNIVYSQQFNQAVPFAITNTNNDNTMRNHEELQLNDGRYACMFTINDYPTQARHQVVDKEVLLSVSNITNTDCCVLGNYIEPSISKLPRKYMGKKKLYIQIIGDDRNSALAAENIFYSIVEAAAKNTLKQIAHSQKKATTNTTN